MKLPIHDDFAAMQHLANCARAIGVRFHNPVENDLAIAAIAFTMQIAISAHLGEPAALRELEAKLVAMFMGNRQPRARIVKPPGRHRDPFPFNALETLAASGYALYRSALHRVD